MAWVGEEQDGGGVKMAFWDGLEFLMSRKMAVPGLETPHATGNSIAEI